MPQSYKGTTIPAYTDTADAVEAFSDFVDSGAASGVWTTATRPAAPAVGHTGYNTTLGAHEYFNGSTWALVVPSLKSRPQMYGASWVDSGVAIPSMSNTTFLMQAGRVAENPGGDAMGQINFPNAFPNACLNVQLTPIHFAGGATVVWLAHDSIYGSAVTKSRFTYSAALFTGGHTDVGVMSGYEFDFALHGITIYFDWLAIGY